MGAEKLNHSLESMQLINDSWQDYGDHEADHEETLSLCDLVVSSDANEYWNHPQSNSPSHHHHQNQNQNHDQDLFEFFSEEFPASTYHNGNNNIMFCGKLIPCKDQQSNDIEDKSQSSKTSKVKQENDEKLKNIRNCLFPWKVSPHPFNKSRTFPSSSASTKVSQRKGFYKSFSMPASRSDQNKKMGDDHDDDKFDFSVKKVSILATPVKSRWYLFAFGVGRFPMEIELKDMKMRQSRKSKAMKFKAPEAGSKPKNIKDKKERRRSGKGLWRLFKVLGWKMLL